MSLETLWRRDDGVSKVVGVVLMVAITVLLAAVIGLMAGGMDEEAPTEAELSAIQASFSFSFEDNGTSFNATNTESGEDQVPPYNDRYTTDNLTIAYDGGTALSTENIRVRMSGPGTGFKYINDTGALKGGAAHQSERRLADMELPSDLSAGDSVTITTIIDDVYGVDGSGDPVWPGLTAEMNEATVRIIYEHPSNGQSYILAEWAGPAA